MAYRQARHHQWPHRRNAKILTDWAKANPAARCIKCGNTLDQCGPNQDGRNRNGTPCTWDAGHRIDGDPTGGYQLECSACNRRDGTIAGNARRRDPHTPW